MEAFLCHELIYHLLFFHIQVNGGNGVSSSGSGGGGRIMVYYKNTDFWQGKWTAYGGITGSSPGGAGTVFLQVKYNKILIFE